MSLQFTVIVPARLASTRLPNKPLADIHGIPMVVRVAQRAALSGATQVVVAADSPEIVMACEAHGVRALLTRLDHPSGSDRLAEASQLLALGASDIVVFGGGVIPTDDVTQLQDSGVAHVFTPGTPIGDVVEWVSANVGVASVR